MYSEKEKFKNEFKINGPEGGFEHYWRCNNCNITFEATDK
jgi:hypothetical protein